ncbi:MAG: putative RND superfamily exporter protein [Planctomycetota bacterium]|jgi:predicted RND superfamily exporter protein
MEKFENFFSTSVIKYRYGLLPILLVLVAISSFGAKNLYLTNDYQIFFSKENPELLAYEAMENTFSPNNNVFVALQPADGDVFTRETLAVIEQFTEQAWQVPYSTRVDSITNFQFTRAEEDDLTVEDLVKNAKDLSDDELRRIKTEALSEPLLVHRLISPSAHITAINITVDLPGLEEASESPAVIGYVRDLIEQITLAHPDIEIYLTGAEMINRSMAEASYKDITTLIPFSFGLMFLILAILVGGISGTFATIVVIVLSVGTSLGLGGYLGIPISPPSSIAPTVIMTVAIANCVHILASFRQAIYGGLDKKAAISESLRVNIQPVFLASMTTTLGFLSMNFSDVPPFHDLGNFVAFGVVSSLILSVTFLPIMMLWLPIKNKHTESKRDNAMERLGQFVVANYKPLFWGMLGLICVLILLIPMNKLDDVFVDYFHESIKFRSDTDHVSDNLSGIATLEYTLEANSPGGINDPMFLQEVETFSNWFREQAETVHVNSVTDIFKRLNRNMHGDDDAMYSLPENRELSAQYLLLYEMSLPYGLDLNNQINIDKSSTRLIVTLEKTSSIRLLDLNRRAELWLAENTSFIEPTVGSSISVMFASLGQRNIRSMLMGTTMALVMISIILIFALRSVKIGLVSLLPNLVPVAMGFGLWGLFVGEVGLGLSVVTTMTMGIVIDDTVHFLSKYLRARRENNMSAEDAVVYAFRTVGRALLITSLILAAGFLVISTSSFALNSDMGLLTAVIITLALLADFFFLPPLLIKLEGKYNEIN